jgi:hypothetical protein
MPKIKRGERAGETISWEEWFKLAKEGIANVTPLQQAKSERVGQVLNIIGILCGLVVMAFSLRQFWWIEIILLGSLLLTAIGLIGIQKKIKVLKEMDTIINSEEVN